MYTRLMFLSALLFFISCNDKKSISKEPAPLIQNTFATPDSFKAGIGKIYEGYLNVQTDLANDDFKTAIDAFSSMHGLIHMLPEEGLDSLTKTAWDSLSSQFMVVLHPMATSKDIAEMRFHLKGFSPLLAKAIDQFGMQTTSPAYLFNCPMADSGKGGLWLQKDKVKANPYFGKAMLDCGDFVREVQPTKANP